MLKIHFKIPELLLAAVLGTALCWGSVGGSISGTVRDASGGIVPAAKVTITNVNTGVSQVVISNDLGVYSFLALPVGTYKLVVTKQGFETYQRSDITLNTNDQLRYDVTLQVGQVTQEIQVTTSIMHVETANTQLGDVIKSRSMEALPLNGRQYTDLLGLQPGVVPVDSAPGKSNTFDSTEQGNVSISGQRETANGFLVNGAVVDNALNNGATVIPNLDSIDEFRVLTADFDAEYGNYSGGMVSVVTKSGANEWHGDGFEFLRNSGMDSRNFYEYNQVNPVTNQEIPGSARGILRRNQFGGTLGGPIKHNKVFFFADYQGTRQSQGIPSGLVLVPTMAERNGDFSAVASTLFTGSVSGPYFAGLLSQELGYPVSASEPYYTPGCVSASQCVFPNGVVPSSAFTAPSRSLLKYIPLPNEGPYFVTSANDQHTRDDLGGLRIDGNSNRWGMLS
ncbi:MAG TPA: carboxypeptidase-like regulatory domain-containing protein, partial [Terriglobia bacterium]|nr:carboxypeptidase-like regulatory domain-containing protein [Terriglobia bacterium]